MMKEQKDRILRVLVANRNDYVRECERRIAEEQGKITGADRMANIFLDILDAESQESEEVE